MSTRFRKQLLAADGTRLAWHVHRDGPTDVEPQASAVLLTNGVGTSENFWRFVVAGLRTRHTVAHWDYRGHGGSEIAKSGDYSLARHVEDLEAVVDAVRALTGRPAVHHVAFSMGVRVVLEAYRRRPETFASLTLIAGGAAAPGPAFVSARAVTRTLAKSAMDVVRPAIPLANPFIKAVMGSKLAYPLARLTGVVRPTAARQDIEAMAQHMRGMDLHAFFDSVRDLFDGDSSDVLPSVRVPTLVINAKRDLLMSPEAVVRLYEDLPPGARWLEFEDAGHAGLVEVGDALAGAISGFLDDVQPSEPRAGH